MSDAEDRAGAPVVTLFESYRSGTDYIAPREADALGVPFHEQAFSSRQLEESAELREKEGVLGRVLSAMGQSSFGGQRWAPRGGVIVGRNGAFIPASAPRAPPTPHSLSSAMSVRPSARVLPGTPWPGRTTTDR